MPSLDGIDPHRVEGVFSASLRHPFRSAKLNAVRHRSQADRNVLGGTRTRSDCVVVKGALTRDVQFAVPPAKLITKL